MAVLQLKEIPKYGLTYNDKGAEVFWRINVNDLFGVDLRYPGMITAINNAFIAAKPYIPYDSGITYRSFTLRRINDTTVECFFDRNKVIGKTRYGKVVEDYYVQYIAEHPSRYNWLDICIKYFNQELRRQVERINDRLEDDRQIDLRAFNAAYALFLSDYNAKREEARKLLEEEEKKKKEKIRLIQEMRALKRKQKREKGGAN